MDDPPQLPLPQPPVLTTPKLIFMGCGGLSMVAWVVYITFACVAYLSASFAEDAAHSYLATTLPTILETYDPERLMEESSPLFGFNSGAAKQLLLSFEIQLGPLQSIDWDQAQYLHLNTQQGSAIRVEVPAEFEKRKCGLMVSVINTNGKWQIAGLHILFNGPVL
jgi:hypothetical protein